MRYAGKLKPAGKLWPGDLLRKIDEIFLSDNPEEISNSDRAWFYGPLLLIFALSTLVYISTL